MERNPADPPDSEGDDLFGNPENVDGSIEEGLDERLQSDADEHDDD